MVNSRQKEPEGSQVMKGFQVYTIDNKRIGKVVGVEPDFSHISKGVLFTTDCTFQTAQSIALSTA